jgi:hypothetical protein
VSVPVWFHDIPLEQLANDSELVHTIAAKWIQFCMLFAETKLVQKRLQFETPDPHERATRIIGILHESPNLKTEEFIDNLRQLDGGMLVAQKSKWNLSID